MDDFWRLPGAARQHRELTRSEDTLVAVALAIGILYFWIRHGFGGAMDALFHPATLVLLAVQRTLRRMGHTLLNCFDELLQTPDGGRRDHFEEIEEKVDEVLTEAIAARRHRERSEL